MRPLSLGSANISLTLREALGELVLVPADAGEAALPGQRMLAPLVVVDVQQIRVEVLDVRDLAVVEVCVYPSRIQRLTIQSVRHDDVGADVFAERQLVLHLGVVGVVVVDVFAVVDLDPGLLGEGVERRVGAGVLVGVEVERPVGPDHLLVGRRDVGRRLRLAAPVGAHAARASAVAAGGRAGQDAAAGQLCPPGAERRANGSADLRAGIGP